MLTRIKLAALSAIVLFGWAVDHKLQSTKFESLKSKLEAKEAEARRIAEIANANAKSLDLIRSDYANYRNRSIAEYKALSASYDNYRLSVATAQKQSLEDGKEYLCTVKTGGGMVASFNDLNR